MSEYAWHTSKKECANTHVKTLTLPSGNINCHRSGSHDHGPVFQLLLVALPISVDPLGIAHIGRLAFFLNANNRQPGHLYLPALFHHLGNQWLAGEGAEELSLAVEQVHLSDQRCLLESRPRGV